MKTKVEIIKETVEYYSKNPRGVRKAEAGGFGFRCVYYNEDSGAMCAVGRCLMIPEQYSTIRENIYCSFDWIGGLDARLKPEYRGHKLRFWVKLQTFHDTGGNWEEKIGEPGNVLTFDGRNEYNQLIAFKSL